MKTDKRGLTLMLSSIALSGSNSNATVAVNGTSQYCIQGAAYVKSTGSVTLTTDAVTGQAFLPVNPGYGCIFVHVADQSQVHKAIQSEIVLLTPESDGDDARAMNPLDFPNIPDEFCPMGYQVIKVGTAGSAWTMGVSISRDVANTYHQFTSIISLPRRALEI